MKNIIDKEEALATFEDAANEHGEATEQGNYKLGNICYDKIILAVTFLKENNGIPLLLPFLRHDSIGVRIWAASYLLQVYEQESIETLELAAANQGANAFTAKITLEEWREGTLQL